MTTVQEGPDKRLWTSHHADVTEQPDGSWVAQYPGFSWKTTGATSDEALDSLGKEFDVRAGTPEYLEELKALIDNALDPNGTPVAGFEAAYLTDEEYRAKIAAAERAMLGDDAPVGEFDPTRYTR